MSADNSTAIPMANLTAMWDGYKNGINKPIAIVNSSSAIVSTISSSLLIWIISKSRNRLRITQHRLLFGMSIGDILFSLPQVTFHAILPGEMNYMVWNAKGNAATCDAQGFLIMGGMILTLLYSCGLNLYYLAVVKYKTSPAYIERRIEPFLHGVPIVLAASFSITFLVNKNYNDSGAGWCGGSPIYEPPHCIGYESGQAREGFTIPCGRGSAAEVYLLTVAVFTLLPPVIISVSLGMIYWSVAKLERRMTRYGRESFSTSQNEDDQRVNRRSSVTRFVGSISRRRSSSNNNENNSNSGVVLQKALAYSVSYFLAWIWPIVYFILSAAGIWFQPGSRGDVIYTYFWTILNPLEGFFNLLIYLHPDVVKVKRSSDISWCRAFAKIFVKRVKGYKQEPPCVNDIPTPRGES